METGSEVWREFYHSFIVEMAAMIPYRTAFD